MPRPAVDAYASLPHFHRHLDPIVARLRARDRVDVRCWSRGAECDWPVMRPLDRDAVRLAVVASWDDAQRFADKSVAYVEHGAGQSYVGTLGTGYAGAPQMDHAALFVCPNVHVAARWRRAYPNACVVTVGAPALDVHFRGVAHCPNDDGRMLLGGPAVVAFTFHWRCSVVPETMPALPHYAPVFPAVLAALGANGSSIVGSSHPRARGPQKRFWTEHGVRHESDPDVILRTADVLVADNTSLMYEAAAVGIPVVALNAPWYRRDVQHGLRFWSHVPGIQCDEPEQLVDAVARAYAREGESMRVRAAAYAYSAVDGCAAERAAAAIEHAAFRSGLH